MKTKIEPLITLLTDFGRADWFAGTMKGVIASISPGCRVIDISHEIEPGNIKQAALALKCSYRFFPPGTVHLVVVDPGVGSDREVLLVSGGGYSFIAPDNGVLSYIFAELPAASIYRVTGSEFFLKPLSSTFHGRDLFAPLAAHLAAGKRPEELGELFSRSPVTFPLPAARPEGEGSFQIEIVSRDRFGNLFTSLPSARIAEEKKEVELEASGRRQFLPLVKSYGAVGRGKPLAIRGSCGYLELAVNGGDASRELKLKVGDTARITFK